MLSGNNAGIYVFKLNQAIEKLILTAKIAIYLGVVTPELQIAPLYDCQAMYISTIYAKASREV